ncbi:IclR family transcriptional regulator [Pseudonocardia sp. GCM10023141]|uniref:IclR family transcriptional regulator n=1 Tax=Pseudonocardia sp. GCM10023141 TaxID=3252653 RepID=UPI003615D86B
MVESSGGGGVQAVERAFELLEVVARAGGAASISEIADAAGLPLPTIHRLLRTLVTGGYMRQQPNRRYALGPRLIPLGDVASGMLGSWAQPVLSLLVETLGESANLAMPDGDLAVYVAQVPSTRSMRMFTEVGKRVALHSTGVGKALLSQLPDAEVRALVARTGMPAMTARTITDPDLLLAELARARARGYVVDDSEQEMGVHCVAVPVTSDGTRMAVSVSGPATRMTDELVERAVRLLGDAAVELRSRLAVRSSA